MERRQPPSEEKYNITPAAIEIFRAMCALKCTCNIVLRIDREDVDCPACQEFDRLDDLLGRELQLAPWQFPTFVTPAEGEPVHPPGSGAYEWHPHAQELYHALVRASGDHL